tara:strand:- start:3344 stop:5725 length:2382 start_codon:yes stop_codon:yes gene_type:complete
MKISESWLRKWIKTDFNADELGYRLTMLGHEVNEITTEGQNIEDITIVEVVSTAKHPNADKLSLCKINDGSSELIDVVCGAPNVVKGMKTAFAKPGIKLPNGVKLNKAKIRGVMSNGMLCSANEIGLGVDADGIISLPKEAKIGTKLIKFLDLPDSIFDLDLTPNRGDCFSVQGIARDISALIGSDLINNSKDKNTSSTIDDTYPIELIEPNACPRFVGQVIRGIKINAKTPIWMKEQLRRSGLRSISPIVDITNYVMLELGQPLHAYDLNKLDGPVKPRMSKEGESLTLLDEKTISLNDNTLVITDDSGPIGIAGIMGGFKTAVTHQTQDIFLESAFFPQNIISGRARIYGMHTDASIRFERGVDPTGQVKAIERANELIVEITGASIGPISDKSFKELLPNRSEIYLRRNKLNKLLGIKIEDEVIEKILLGLNMKIHHASDGWKVLPPHYRFDLSIEADLVEEIARIHGYDSIPSIDYCSKNPLKVITESEIDFDTVSATLIARDYQEILTYSFVNAESNKIFSGIESELILSNPISSEMSVMRASLWPSLVNAAASNNARQQDRIRFFEISKSFHGKISKHIESIRIAGLATGLREPEQWSNNSELVDFFDIKSDVEALLSLSCDINNISFLPIKHPALQPGQAAEIFRGKESIGVLGKLHPKINKKYNLKRSVYLFELDAEKTLKTNVPTAKNISKFPIIRRDISVIVDEDISADNIMEVVTSSSQKLLRNINIFDVYRGPGIEVGRKSIAMGLILQETSRTLTDMDADNVVSDILKNLQNQFKAEIRD